MLISRQNNKIIYSYETPPKTKSLDKTCLLPIPLINTKSLYEVSLKKWYIVNHEVVDKVINTYIEAFYEFTNMNSRYNVYFDKEKFCHGMIKNLYNSSQSKNKSFI